MGLTPARVWDATHVCRQRVHNFIAFNTGECNPSALVSLAFNGQLPVIRNEPHFASLPPPPIHLARVSNPDVSFRSELIEFRQQTPECRLGTSTRYVIWMNNEADETVLFQDQIDLMTPQIHGVVVQDVKK